MTKSKPASGRGSGRCEFSISSSSRPLKKLEAELMLEMAVAVAIEIVVPGEQVFCVGVEIERIALDHFAFPRSLNVRGEACLARAVVGIKQNDLPVARSVRRSQPSRFETGKVCQLIFCLLRGWEKLLHQAFLVGLEGFELLVSAVIRASRLIRQEAMRCCSSSVGTERRGTI